MPSKELDSPGTVERRTGKLNYAEETKGCKYIAAWKRWWFHLKCISFCFAKPSNLNGVLLDGMIPNENFLVPEDTLEMIATAATSTHVWQRVYVIRYIYLRGSVRMFYSQTSILSLVKSWLCQWLGQQQQGRWIRRLVNSAVFNADRPDISRFYP